MATAAPTRRELERKTAVARLEAEEVRASLVHLQQLTAMLDTTDDSLEEIRRTFEQASRMIDRLLEAIDVPIGLTVEQAAERLDVAQPTVRKWLREGLLKPIPDRKPIQLEGESVVSVERALARVREQYPAREWTKALAAYLHDQDLQGQDWFRKGRSALHSGSYIEL